MLSALFRDRKKKKGTRWKLRLWFSFLKSKRVIVTCLHSVGTDPCHVRPSCLPTPICLTQTLFFKQTGVFSAVYYKSHNGILVPDCKWFSENAVLYQTGNKREYKRNISRGRTVMESNTIKLFMMKEEPEPHLPHTWLLSVSCGQVHEAGIGMDLSRIIRLHTHWMKCTLYSLCY
jgi:hypothetical protein